MRTEFDIMELILNCALIISEDKAKLVELNTRAETIIFISIGGG